MNEEDYETQTTFSILHRKIINNLKLNFETCFF